MSARNSDGRLPNFALLPSHCARPWIPLLSCLSNFVCYGLKVIALPALRLRLQSDTSLGLSEQKSFVVVDSDIVTLSRGHALVQNTRPTPRNKPQKLANAPALP